MNTVATQIKYLPKASRLELIVRFIWAIPTVIVLFVFGIVAAACFVFQWFHILFAGRRNKTLHAVVKTFIIQRYRFTAYFMLLTDERPPIVPDLEKV